MAIVRFANDIVTQDAETFAAFKEQFPSATEIKLPEGAQAYKLFRVEDSFNGEQLPKGDDIIVINFAKRMNGPVVVTGWDRVWYNDVSGKPRFKNLEDMNNA